MKGSESSHQMSNSETIDAHGLPLSFRNTRQERIANTLLKCRNFTLKSRYSWIQASGMKPIAVAVFLTFLSAHCLVPFGPHIGSTWGSVAYAAEFSEAELDRIGKLPSRFERKLALYKILEDADGKTLGSYLDVLDEVDSSQPKSEAEVLIIEKWAAIDPLAALARVEKLPELRARKLLETLFSEWSQSDLKAALEHVSKWSTYRKHFAFEIILLSRSDLEGSQKHSIARQLGIEHTAASIIAMAMRAVPITDAADAWHSFYMANANGISTLSNEDRRLMEAIAEKLVDELGAGAFDLVIESVRNYGDKMWVLPLVVNRLAETEPEIAYQLTSELKRDKTAMLNGVVYRWAKSDPQQALETVSMNSNHRERTSLQKTVLQVWASSVEPQTILHTVPSLPENSRTLAREYAIQKMAELAPEDAVAHLLEVSDEASRDRLENLVAETWAKNDLTAAFAWVSSEPSIEDKRFKLMERMLVGAMRTDPDLAMETALATPTDDSGVGLEAKILREIAKKDADGALQLLQFARNEETKRLALLSIGSGFLLDGDEESLDKAMGLTSHLEAEEDRHRNMRSLMIGWILAGKWKEHYERIDEYPTPELRAFAARLAKAGLGEILTPGQIKTLDSYLLDESD